MAQVRLGRITLHWCPHCDVPLVEKAPCGLCGGAPSPVALTPPGDARPAFPFDIEMVRSLADAQFGPGSGKSILPDGAPVLLNRIPDLDRTDEVVAGGGVLANLTWILGKGFVLQLRMAGVERVWNGAARQGAAGSLRSWVVADKGAVPSILNGSNLLGPGVAACASGIAAGDEVILLEETGTGRAPIGTGMAKMPSESMAALSRGNAVKVRWVREKTSQRAAGSGQQGGESPQGTGSGGTDAAVVPRSPDPAARCPLPADSISWSDAVAANRAPLDRAIARAVSFIKEGVSRVGKPVAVSYSGGKDSLATLLLVLEAGMRPKVLFADTGLEFPETVENVRKTASALGLELVVEEAGEAFWENLPRFGPPGRDARWCCKCCKLGPITRLISREFPGGVLSFIGQRRYESEARASKGPVWKNPWVPGQTGASPIQEWTSFSVWLYIFSKKAAYNPWYERGLDRIGCFLCPATNFADLELVRKSFSGYERWQEKLRDLPPMWREYGLWRWRWLPNGVREHLAQRGLSPEAAPQYPPRLSLDMKEPAACENGLEAAGRFSRALELEALAGRLRALGRTELVDDRLAVGDWAEIGRDGTVRVRGADGAEVKKRQEKLREAVARSEECAGCGVCTGKCKEGAAAVRKGRMVIEAEKCTQCGACLTGPCPVTTYSPGTQEDVG
jgi:phosphoadenosine phosphosulfate reductase